MNFDHCRENLRDSIDRKGQLDKAGIDLFQHSPLMRSSMAISVHVVKFFSARPVQRKPHEMWDFFVDGEL